MLKIYLYKCLLILSVSTFSINYCCSQEESSEKAVPSKRAHTELEQVSQADTQPGTIPPKKQKTEERGTSENREEEEREATEEEIESKPSDFLPPEHSITKAADIGTWVGDKENGIANFQLSYQGTLISEEIKKWHLEMGAQINQIINLRGLKKNKNNYIRARIDIAYRKGQSYEIKGASIPILFISGHSNQRARQKVVRLEQTIAHITSDPSIPIDSYYDWVDLGKENYEGIRNKLEPLYARIPEHDLINPELVEKEKDSLIKSTSHAFQFWIHSEEPLILYILGEPAKKANNTALTPTFSEIMGSIKLPEDAVPKLCILSMVSRNDCCTHCRPLLLEAMEHQDFFDNHVLEGLKHKATAGLTKILLYSALKEFKINRPQEGYLEAINIQRDNKVHFLMAENKVSP
ncbi:hypothetical protein [Candidatus Odyssella thessalonicensis]|uniref:hypothetical protein n=1 Tax=Candidatus Odyssella thessalonicensis TaxID=84647 RepID=UPI000225B4A0|nr:hypothetical protein [Candidatus Odyssella thessalonicensis]